MKIRYKLILVFLVISILFSGVGYYGIQSTKRVGDIFQDVETEEVPSLTALLEIIAAARQASIKAMEYAIRGDSTDQDKARQALRKVEAGMAIYQRSEQDEDIATKRELDARINAFVSVIESYLSLSAGPAFQTVIAEEAELHRVRSVAVREINEAINHESAKGTVELLSIKGEIRKVSIKAIEFFLRGEAKDLEKAREAIKEADAVLQQYISSMHGHPMFQQSIGNLVTAYLRLGRGYLELLSRRSASAAEKHAKEKEVHKLRRELIHTLYPLIEKERGELQKAADATRTSIANASYISMLSDVLVVLIALGAGFAIALSISRPIARLNQAVHETGKGDLDSVIRINSKDEVGTLADSFNAMKQELKAHRDHLEEIVADRTAALERSNKELESFSYSIAHDLRAPLRTITSFSQILKEDAYDKLNKEDLDHIDRVINSAKRMAELIDALLDFSRISRQEINVTSVDLTALARRAASHLESSTDGYGIEWKIQDDISATGDPKLLEIVMQNLLDNAYKYSGKNDRPVIEFGASENNGDNIYFVRDKGVGFDTQYADKLFGVFQRLHGKEFEGTGIGLATVERVIHRHGGQIWAESEIGKGSTFYFTLPTPVTRATLRSMA